MKPFQHGRFLNRNLKNRNSRLQNNQFWNRPDSLFIVSFKYFANKPRDAIPPAKFRTGTLHSPSN
jgi:hypothetical protein